MSLPTASPAAVKAPSHDTLLLKLAREIAMDIHPIEEILAKNSITQEQWTSIQNRDLFQTYLRSFVQEWNSAINTGERVRLKSMAFVEESLPEFYARAHDAKENLNAKVEVLKTVARFAGIGGNVDAAVSGERFSVTINLGADKSLKIEKTQDPQTIEGTYQ